MTKNKVKSAPNIYWTSPNKPSPPAKAKRIMTAMLTKKDITAAVLNPIPGAKCVAMISPLTGITMKYINKAITLIPITDIIIGIKFLESCVLGIL